MKKLLLISLAMVACSYIARADYGNVNVYKVSTPMTINADTADWAGIPAFPVMQRSGGTAQEGFYSRTKLAWDNDNIYVLNVVTDNELFDGNGNGSSWNNDCVELFFQFGPDTAAQPRTNTAYDFWQIRFQVRNPFLDGEKNGTANIDSTKDLTGMHRKFATTATGYIMEWQIPWADLTTQFSPAVDALFKFDEQTADANAAGKGRVASYFVSTNPAAAANDYVTGAVYPVAKLVAGVTAVGTVQTANTLKVYSALNEIRLNMNVNGTVYNSNGQIVAVIKNANVVNTSGWKSGLYLFATDHGTAKVIK